MTKNQIYTDEQIEEYNKRIKDYCSNINTMYDDKKRHTTSVKYVYAGHFIFNHNNSVGATKTLDAIGHFIDEPDFVNYLLDAYDIWDYKISCIGNNIHITRVKTIEAPLTKLVFIGRKV